MGLSDEFSGDRARIQETGCVHATLDSGKSRE